MGGIVSSIFGGGSTNQQQTSSTKQKSQSYGEQSSSQASAPVDLTPGAFTDLRAPLSTSIQQMLSQGGGPQFQGPMAAGMTGGENQLLQAIQQQAGQPSGAFQAGSGFLQSLLQGGNQGILQQAIEAAQRPLIQAFNEETLPGLRAQFALAGQQPQGARGSSPFQMAQARASSGLADALGDISTNITSQGINQQLQAASQASGLDTARMENLMTGLEASALPRLIEQLGIDRGMEEFRNRQQQLLQLISTAGGLAAPTLGQVSEGRSAGFQRSLSEGSSGSVSSGRGSTSSGGFGEAIGTGLSMLLKGIGTGG